jgi:U3 small nucleolar RNA-associated protein 25
VAPEKEKHQRKRRKVETNERLSGGTNGRNLQETEDQDTDPELREPDLDEELDPEPEFADDQAEDEEIEEDDIVPSDAFEIHFANPDESTLASRIAAITKLGWDSEKRPFGTVGKCQIYTPKGEQRTANYPEFGNSIAELDIKKRLLESAQRVLNQVDEMEKALVSPVFGYKDVLFGDRNTENASKLRGLVCLHALNHIFKTRDKVLKNNARLSKEDTAQDVEHKDQGFTRPKVLIILPTKQSCVRMVNSIVDLCGPDQQENRKRFEEAYVHDEGRVSADRPEDFQELFEGNDDDMFRLGLKFTRKTVKFFAQFYNSDIIFASPLGLRRAIESEK